jgi:hypothetical protein
LIENQSGGGDGLAEFQASVALGIEFCFDQIVLPGSGTAGLGELSAANGLTGLGARTFGFGMGSRPSRCAFLRSSLRALRIASAFSQMRLSESFS